MDPNIMGAVLQRLQGGPDAGPPPGMPPGLPMGPPDLPLGPGGPPPGMIENDAPGPRDPLVATKTVIQDLHSLIATLPDATHTQLASQALTILTKIQRDLMASGNGNQGGGNY